MTQEEHSDPIITLTYKERCDREEDYLIWCREDAERLSLVETGLDNYDLEAPRPPLCILEMFADDGEIGIKQVLWRLYLPHLPWSPSMSLEEAGWMFPYADHLLDKHHRKLTDGRKEVANYLAKDGKPPLDEPPVTATRVTYSNPNVREIRLDTTAHSLPVETAIGV